jgi:ATP-dependent Clp protease adaptor protein ClpS
VPGVFISGAPLSGTATFRLRRRILSTASAPDDGLADWPCRLYIGMVLLNRSARRLRASAISKIRFGDRPGSMLQPVTRGIVSSDHDSEGAGSRSPEREGDGRSGTAIITKTKPRTKRPNLYRVLLLNDDYTPMEFVIHVLERFFNKSREDATRIMLHVHHNGVGECGIFTYEVAETKVTQVMDFARKHQHPLQCVMEKK